MDADAGTEEEGEREGSAGLAASIDTAQRELEEGRAELGRVEAELLRQQQLYRQRLATLSSSLPVAGEESHDNFSEWAGASGLPPIITRPSEIVRKQ